ncbi:hypothetical protein HK102_011785, partial [Quaeritorhiza haematococci]
MVGGGRPESPSNIGGNGARFKSSVNPAASDVSGSSLSSSSSRPTTPVKNRPTTPTTATGAAGGGVVKSPTTGYATPNPRSPTPTGMMMGSSSSSASGRKTPTSGRQTPTSSSSSAAIMINDNNGRRTPTRPGSPMIPRRAPSRPHPSNSSSNSQSPQMSYHDPRGDDAMNAHLYGTSPPTP